MGVRTRAGPSKEEPRDAALIKDTARRALPDCNTSTHGDTAQ